MSMVSFDSANTFYRPLFNLYTQEFNIKMVHANHEDMVPDTQGYAAVKEFDEDLSETYALYTLNKLVYYI